MTEMYRWIVHIKMKWIDCVKEIGGWLCKRDRRLVMQKRLMVCYVKETGGWLCKRDKWLVM